MGFEVVFHSQFPQGEPLLCKEKERHQEELKVGQMGWLFEHSIPNASTMTLI